MGLPGAGKTTLAKVIIAKLQDMGKTVTWLNADVVRKQYDDWDFSLEGRIRQSKRMREMAENCPENPDFVVCDFIAPLPELRENFAADITVWVDTINAGRYDDTNQMFVPPTTFDFRITEQNAEVWGEEIVKAILKNDKIHIN